MQSVDIGSTFEQYWNIFIECAGSYFSQLSAIRIFGVSLLDIFITFAVFGLIITVFVVVNRVGSVYTRFNSFYERSRRYKDE